MLAIEHGEIGEGGGTPKMREKDEWWKDSS
jgi:hypothetical protein